MNDVASLTRRITEDLRTLQNAMQATKQQLSDGAHEGLVHEIIDTELIAEFKGAIDEIRHSLWCYVEAAAWKHQNHNMQTSAEGRRLRLVSEMLRSLSQTNVPVTPTLPGTMSFFERIDFVVSGRLSADGQRCELTENAA